MDGRVTTGGPSSPEPPPATCQDRQMLKDSGGHMYSDDEYPTCFDNRENFFAGCPQARYTRDTHLRGARYAEDATSR